MRGDRLQPSRLDLLHELAQRQRGEETGASGEGGPEQGGVAQHDAPGQSPVSDAEAHRSEDAAERWPLLFFAIWSLIHLEGASPDEAREAVVGPL